MKMLSRFEGFTELVQDGRGRKQLVCSGRITFNSCGIQFSDTDSPASNRRLSENAVFEIIQ